MMINSIYKSVFKLNLDINDLSQHHVYSNTSSFVSQDIQAQRLVACENLDTHLDLLFQLFLLLVALKQIFRSGSADMPEVLYISAVEASDWSI